jgi:hypothetical protein
MTCAETLEDFDHWIHEGAPIFTYNSELDELFWKAILALNVDEMVYNDELAKILGVDILMTELIQTVLCYKEYCEYGTSPRGCWLTKDCEKLLDLFRKHKANPKDEK